MIGQVETNLPDDGSDMLLLKQPDVFTGVMACASGSETTVIVYWALSAAKYWCPILDTVSEHILCIQTEQ